MHAAPLIIIPLSCQRIYIDQYVRRDPSWADPGRWPMPWWHLDTAMAALLILLTAVDEGLAAIFFGIVDHETRALPAEFGIPDDHTTFQAFAEDWRKSRDHDTVRAARVAGFAAAARLL